MTTSGNDALIWCKTLSEPTTRPADAGAVVCGWMEQAGFRHWRDAVGNLRARFEAARPDAPVVILGASFDALPDAAFGLALPLQVMAQLKADGATLPFHLDLVGFAQEPLLPGMPLPDDVAPRAYLETHIEPGPVLRAEELPVGIVSAIAGARRFSIHFTGVTGHAGTVPMHLRRDALAAAAEFTLIVERVAREHGVIATVGELQVRAGTVDRVAGDVTLSLDIRSEQDSERDTALNMIWDTAKLACRERGIEMQWDETHASGAVACADELQLHLATAIERQGLPPRYLVSGGARNARAMAGRCPVAMLFVRRTGGIDRPPAESVTAADLDVATRVLKDWILGLE